MTIESATTGKKTGPHTKKRKIYEDNVTHVTSLFAEKTRFVLYSIMDIMLAKPSQVLPSQKWRRAKSGRDLIFIAP